MVPEVRSASGDVLIPERPMTAREFAVSQQPWKKRRDALAIKEEARVAALSPEQRAVEQWESYYPFEKRNEASDARHLNRRRLAGVLLVAWMGYKYLETMDELPEWAPKPRYYPLEGTKH